MPQPKSQTISSADPESHDTELGAPRSNEQDDEFQGQAAALAAGSAAPQGLFLEFRRKLAACEVVSRAAARLAEALRFSGRVTITFHQGKVTKTVLEESYFQGRPRM